jgi:hypothetical protein
LDAVDNLSDSELDRSSCSLSGEASARVVFSPSAMEASSGDKEARQVLHIPDSDDGEGIARPQTEQGVRSQASSRGAASFKAPVFREGFASENNDRTHVSQYSG